MIPKKYAIILIIIFFLGALGALVWFYFSFNPLPKTNNNPVTPVTNEVYDPFGTNTTNNSPAIVGTTTSDINPVTNIELPIDRLRQITSDPVSGFSVAQNIQTGKIDIHYILRANGNIYETYTDSTEQRRLSITTIPKVYESYWLPDGLSLIVRYLKEGTDNIESYSVKINSATSTLNEFEGSITGNYLSDNIKDLAINPRGDKIFYLIDNLNGSSGYVSKPNGENKKTIFSSPLSLWHATWPKEETITLTTKPASDIEGYLYFLNSQTGTMTRVLGGVKGLTTKTNPTATQVLYSDSLRNNPRLYLYDVKTGENKLLPWSTFPEKCLWSKTNTELIYCAVPKTFSTGDYPDIWYQGLASLSDDLWMINTDTGASTLIFDIEKETSNNLDIIDMQIDKDNNYLYFINKTDLTLWSLNLK